MSNKIELFDIMLSKDGTRLVGKLQAQKLTATNYKGDEITLEQGDYVDIAQLDEVKENLNFLLENEYIGQDLYDKKMGFLTDYGDSFRAKVSVRKKK